MALEFKKAQRKATPQIISISSVSGGGKTKTALLLAAGLAGPGGKVGMIDAENGRGEMYTDDPDIMAALPDGFVIADLRPPFTPAAYIEAIDAAEKAGIAVCVIDSGSHEWEGPGGCSDIAAADGVKFNHGKPTWARAKIENRKYVYRLMYSTMHIIVCLRAREKTKIVDKKDSPTGQQLFIPLGIQPICEKGFVYEMLISISLDEKTHFPTRIKVPGMLHASFPGDRMVTKADGERIRQWNESGASVSPIERLKKQARMKAEEGTEAYMAFFNALNSKLQQALVSSTHEENRATAAMADEDAAMQLASKQEDGEAA